MEENKQDYTSIMFDLKPPKSFTESVMNTIVLLISDIKDMQEYKQWDNVDTVILNSNIDKAISNLESLKIIEFNKLEEN